MLKLWIIRLHGGLAFTYVSSYGENHLKARSWRNMPAARTRAGSGSKTSWKAAAAERSVTSLFIGPLVLQSLSATGFPVLEFSSKDSVLPQTFAVVQGLLGRWLSSISQVRCLYFPFKTFNSLFTFFVSCPDTATNPASSSNLHSPLVLSSLPATHPNKHTEPGCPKGA